MSETRVLLVDDNPLDARMFANAARGHGVSGRIDVADTGERAVEMLRSTSAYGLVLLDLHLPGIDGFEVLATLKADPDLCVTPVVVLSSSKNPDDIDRAYEAGAAAYVTKPVGSQGYDRVLGALVAFWSDTVTLPTATH